eukprot:TRINITY_DN13250_c0_g1_i12.p1 TRINITY_DN13250_c0_g1~~TRINITY_DN13250_c0_g1_i12.p1  ORF type:complete len:107 (-),score=10.57 TRINITY_DN13250_c0_g1_i12:710-1030(-)
MLIRLEHFESTIDTLSFKQNEEVSQKTNKEIPKKEIKTPYNLEQMETAINEWTQTIEHQLNVTFLYYSFRPLRTHWRRRRIQRRSLWYTGSLQKSQKNEKQAPPRQ